MGYQGADTIGDTLMFIMLKKLLFIFATVVLLSPVNGNASDDQFYFVARQAPAGSITAAGQSQQVVYLRWDPVEGRLPADVVGFRLLRNGVLLNAPDFPASGIMSVSEIDGLYQAPEQQRRKLEIITRLNELAASNGDSFSAANFASYLHGLLNAADLNTYNPLWSFLGSRTDFNIARARYRGWVDATPATGTVEYELLAVNAVGATARLGLTRVEPGVPNTFLGASNLKQVLNSDTRCDMPENAKDHYTVALNWSSPGENTDSLVISDRIATQLYISGFDLYRSSENLAPEVTQAPVRDIASLAAAASADSRGNPLISGLQKVNVSLVIDSGTTTDDPKWLEARDLLKRAGLKPGDRRGYYLVPRDFTGNYGPTIATIVEVPLMTRPPAPWNIRTFADETSSALARGTPDALTLSWDKVNLENYLRMFQDTRRYCNLVEAQQTGVLEFVGIDQDCNADVRSSVRLDVVDYRIYRFTDFDTAGRFKDSDGDGVADSDERVFGLQCDATQQPVAAKNHLAPPNSIQLLIGGGFSPTDPEVVRLRDRVPAAVKDTVFWYRIASVAGTPDDKGRLSFLSAPQRGLFPDRTPPLEPDVEVLKPGKKVAGCELISDPDALWSYTEEIDTKEKGNNFTLSCSIGGSYSAPEVSSITGNSCVQILTQCAGDTDIVLTSPATELTGNVECSATIPNDVEFCKSGSLTLVPKIIDEMVAAQPGDLVPGGVTVTVKPKPNSKTCIALYESIDGTATRIGSTCDEGGLNYQPGNGPFCGYAIASDENNNLSTTVHFPCTLAPKNPKAPTPPQILSLTVDDAQARFTFRLPAEQAAVTLARLDHEPGDGGADRELVTIPVINAEPGQVISHTMLVNPLLLSKDRFCLSLKAVARNAGSGTVSSQWGKQRCYTRLAGGEEDLPVYMPWPAVNAPDQGEVLIGGLVSNFRKVPAHLTMRIVRKSGLLEGCERLLPGQPPGGIPDPLQPEQDSNQFDALECTDAGMAAVKAALAQEMNFILYRQSRIVGESEGPWIQVSPLIEFAHFDDIPTRQTGEKDTPSFIEWRLNDPFVKFIFIGAPAKDELRFVYLDRYPFSPYADLTATQLYEFRYQAVYFDKSHRPIRWRQSEWFRQVD